MLAQMEPRNDPNFVLSTEIFDGLERARKPNNGTSYWIHPDYPGIFVKSANHGYSRQYDDIDEVRSEFRTYYDIKVPNMRVVHFSVLERAGELAVVAERVYGTRLEDEISVNPIAREQYDSAFAGQVALVSQIRGQDRVFPYDTYGPQQCMWGRLYGEDEKSQGILFVDIEASGDLFRNLESFGDDRQYLEELLVIAHSLASIKTRHNATLPSAQQVLLGELRKVRPTAKALLGRWGARKLMDAVRKYDLSHIETVGEEHFGL